MRRYSLLAALGLLLCVLDAGAQFKRDAFTQSYNNDKTKEDSIDVMFSFKEFFGGLGHKNEIKVGTMFAGSTFIPGSSQIYNRQYWKLPIVYGGILGGVGAGAALSSKGNDDAAKWCFIGAGITYWASLMDGVICYKPNDFPQPGKATIYSILCPGLGQIYNREYWKLPIYWGGLVACAYFYSTNKVNFERFRRIYFEATDQEVPYTGPITKDVAQYYKDVYRRYRDYSILAFAVVYLLQIIDANVFSYMHDFDVSDDISLSWSPALIRPDAQYAFSPDSPAGVGVRIGLSF